jgi:hypothetical protein
MYIYLLEYTSEYTTLNVLETVATSRTFNELYHFFFIPCKELQLRTELGLHSGTGRSCCKPRKFNSDLSSATGRLGVPLRWLLLL